MCALLLRVRHIPASIVPGQGGVAVVSYLVAAGFAISGPRGTTMTRCYPVPQVAADCVRQLCWQLQGGLVALELAEAAAEAQRAGLVDFLEAGVPASPSTRSLAYA